MDYHKLRQELECRNPLYFFHDDPDGLSSFLVLYRHIKEGKGIVVKSHPSVDGKFLRKVAEYHPDKIFILDLAAVSDDFLEEVKVPVVWVDHHMPQKPRGAHYFNPRLTTGNIPVSRVCYEAVKQDLWIAMTGIVGDWFYDPVAKAFSEAYPDLLPAHLRDPAQILFDTPIGKLARIFSFVLKGSTDDAMKCVKILTRIDQPQEILDQTSSRGQYLYKRFERINKEYQELYQQACAKASKSPFLTFVYPGSKMSFTGDLSNELLYRFSEKTIIVGREKSGEVKCSVRSRVKILPMVQKSLVGVRGYGGGHEYACGVAVHSEDFERWLASFQELVQDSKAL